MSLHSVAGKSTIYLDSLQYVLPIEENTPIIDYKGGELGELQVRSVIVFPISVYISKAIQVRIVPHTREEPPKSALNPGGDDNDDDEDEEAEKLEELKGKKIGVTVFVDGARGLPPTTPAGLYVKFAFYLEGKAKSLILVVHIAP